MANTNQQEIKSKATCLAFNNGFKLLKFYPKECLTFARRPYRIDYFFKTNKVVVLDLDGFAICRDNVDVKDLDAIFKKPLMYHHLNYFEDSINYIKRV